jgi:hypothetical protein
VTLTLDVSTHARLVGVRVDDFQSSAPRCANPPTLVGGGLVSSASPQAVNNAIAGSRQTTDKTFKFDFLIISSLIFFS